MNEPYDGVPTVRETARLTSRIFVVVIGLVLLAGVVFGMRMFGKTATSETVGKAEAHNQNVSASNRLAAEKKWVETYQAVVAADKNIDVTANDTSEVGKTRHMGVISYCNSVIADYNALADSPLTRDYRPAHLPQTIDETNPATDCKGTTK